MTSNHVSASGNAWSAFVLDGDASPPPYAVDVAGTSDRRARGGSVAEASARLYPFRGWRRKVGKKARPSSR